jgi:hypothetical protein
MYSKGYKFILIKFIAAIVSAIVFSLYSSWRVYTPVPERAPDIGYHPFSVLFAFNVIPNFFIYIIMGLIMSPVIDSILMKNFRLKGTKGIITVIIAYLILGVIGGVVISLFFLRPDFMVFYISESMTAALIFLSVQSVIYYLFFCRRGRGK